jgi:type I restriction enzyme, S subunit
MTNTQARVNRNLGDIVGISKGKKHCILKSNSNGEYKRYIQIEDLRNDNTMKYTNDLQGIEVKFEDIIIAWDGANAGTIGFNLEGLIGSTLARLRIEDKNIFSGYLGWFLRNQSKYLRAHCTGATIPHINKSILEFIKVPLLPYPIQKQIAELLEKVDETKQKRREANKLTEQFLQSAFVEMFVKAKNGDKEIKIKKLSEITTQITDGVHLKPVYKKGGIPFISVKDITTGKLSFENSKYIDGTAHNNYIKRCKPEYLDILYTKVGATYGRPAIVDIDREFSLYVSVALIKPNKDLINPHYLLFAMKSDFVKRQADKRIKGIGVPDLHLVEIKNFDIIVPPLFRQNEFAKLFQKVENLKENQKESEQELDNLFNSLMQKAFNGNIF